MSKMVRPEMSVVRFKEADVIVTSGAVPQSMTASGWGDGTNRNFSVNYGGVDYDYHNAETLMDLLTQNGQNNKVRTTSGADTTLSYFYRHDYNGDDSTSKLGGFDWDSINNRWNSHQ